MLQMQRGVLDFEIEGAVNFRDLGGLPAGDLRVRRGMVFRSGMTHHIGPEGLEYLAERYRVRSFVDLRSEDELERDGTAPFDGSGIRHRCIPVTGITAMTPDKRQERMRALMDGEMTWGQAYRDYLATSVDAFRSFFELVVDAESLSLVFHCTGGRDRTGVSAALLLATLGVDEDTIADDYARTGELLRPHVPKFGQQSEDLQLDERRFERLISTSREPMRELFEYIRQDYGSVDGYLDEVGVAPAVVRELRGRLLEPHPA